MSSYVHRAARRTVAIEEIYGELNDVAIDFANGHSGQGTAATERTANRRKMVYEAAVAAREAASKLAAANEDLVSVLREMRGER